MREIKFRAYDKLDLVMYYSVGLSLIGVQIYKEEEQQMPPETILLDRGRDCFELMQYTGLKDKNGKEIYEGDIIQMYIYHTSPLPIKIITYICFDDGIFAVMKINEEILPLRDAIIISNKTNQGIEVIGNVYENPELLNTPTESV